MVIKIKYYGIDTTNLPLTVELPENSTIENLLDHISEIINDSRSSLLKSSMILVNKAKADNKTSLHDKDELHVLNVLGGG
ncbi:MAG: MoaD/ThiS family protein [Sedimentibacter sp.]